MVRTVYIIIGIIIILVLALPGGERWMLPCPLYTLTGWQCPFCGGQRMLHALLHGNLCEAFVLNPFLFVSIPFFMVCVKYRPTDRLLLIYFILALLWGVFRNVYICAL